MTTIYTEGTEGSDEEDDDEKPKVVMTDDQSTIHRVLSGLADMVATISEYRSLKYKIKKCAEISDDTEFELIKDQGVPRYTDVLDVGGRIPHDNELQFVPRQIAMLIEKFLQIGRDSLVDIGKFEFIIEDLSIMSKTIMDMDTKKICLPEAWLQLSSNQIKYVASHLKNQRSNVNWRNFVIDCMGIPFPTQAQLLNAFHQFQTLDPATTYCVDKNQFDLVTLWFESVNPIEIMQDTTPLIWRECIFDMFSDQDDIFPFIDFLFYFCKDDEPTFGLAKLLAILTDRIVSTSDFPDYRHMVHIHHIHEIHVTDSDIEFLLEEEEIPEEIVYLERAGEGGEEAAEAEEMFWQPVPLSKRLFLIHRRRHAPTPESPISELVPSPIHSEGNLVDEPEKESSEQDERVGEDVLIEGGEDEESDYINNINLFGVVEPFKKHKNSKERVADFEAAVREAAKYDRDFLLGEDDAYYEKYWNEHGLPNSARLVRQYKEEAGEWILVNDIGEKEPAKLPITPPKTDQNDDKKRHKPSKKQKQIERGTSGTNSGGDQSTRGKKTPKKTIVKVPDSDRDSDTGKENQKSKSSKRKGGKKGRKADKDKSESPDQILPSLPTIVEEPDEETEVAGEDAEEEEEEEEKIEMEVMTAVDDSDLTFISLEAFIQAIWFGHKTSYPVKATSDNISKELSKLKELIVEVFHETNQTLAESPSQSLFTGKLSSILRHPFIREILKRYSGFKHTDVPKIVKDAFKFENVLQLEDSASTFSFGSVDERGFYTSSKDSIASSIVSDILYQDTFTDLITTLSVENLQEDIVVNPPEVPIVEAAVEEQPVIEETPLVPETVAVVVARSTTSFNSIRSDSLRGVYLARLSKGKAQSYVSFGGSEESFSESSTILSTPDEELPVSVVPDPVIPPVPALVKTKSIAIPVENPSEEFLLKNEFAKAVIEREKHFYGMLMESFEPTEVELEQEVEGEMEYDYEANQYRISIPVVIPVVKTRPSQSPEKDEILTFHQNLLAKKNFRTSANSTLQKLKLATNFGLDPKLRSLLWQ